MKSGNRNFLEPSGPLQARNRTALPLPLPILQEAGWAPGPVWMGGKSRPHRDAILDRPAHSSVAIPTEIPGPRNGCVLFVL